MQKKIKINFCGFWNSFKKEDNLFTRILLKHFEVEISDSPEFVICSNRGTPFEYMKYDCPRIMFAGENMSPDFTVFDYVIGFDFLEFGDRYFRLPFGFYYDDAKPWVPEIIKEDDAWKILKEKKFFSNFIYGHPSSHGIREKLFEKLNEYKTVISPGSYMNNLVDSDSTTSRGKVKRCSWREKSEYLRLSKFTVAGDSIQYNGFFTEKIVQPFQQHSIPVYFGSTSIDQDFNPASFVWCKDKNDIDRAIEQVIYLDNHDDAYVEKLMKCPLHDREFLLQRYQELETFLVAIFSQDSEQAFRRVRYFAASQHESYLKKYAKRYERTPQIIHMINSKLKQ